MESRTSGSFHVWLLSLTRMHVSGVSPFLLPTGIPLYGYTIIRLSSFSWRTFGLFLVWGFYEQSAMHICVKIFLEICVFISFGKIPRCGSAGSEGSCTLCTFTLASSRKRSSGEMESHPLMALLSFLISVSACSVFISRPHSGDAEQTALNKCCGHCSAGCC